MGQIYNILIADDEVESREYLKECFERYYQPIWEDWEIKVILCEDAAEVREHGPEADVLIVDVYLPERKTETTFPPPLGINVVAELIAGNLVKPNVPIIFISSYIVSKDKLYNQLLNDKAIPKDRCIFVERSYECDVLVLLVKKLLIAIQNRRE